MAWKGNARSGKFNAKRTTVDNITFDSKREAHRYTELKLLQRAGKIFDLECQPAYPIVMRGITVCEYFPDFQYSTGPQQWVVEDVKGVRTPVYRLKKKLVEAQYGIQIQEV